jgi:hypothetical protein
VVLLCIYFLIAVSGLILYNGQQKGGSGDFVSLGLNNSYVEFRFDVGSGPAVIRSDHPIRIGEWHTVKLSRTRKQGTGQVVRHMELMNALHVFISYLYELTLH